MKAIHFVGQKVIHQSIVWLFLCTIENFTSERIWLKLCRVSLCKPMVCHLHCELVWFLFGGVESIVLFVFAYDGRSMKSMVCGTKWFHWELCEVSYWSLGVNLLEEMPQGVLGALVDLWSTRGEFSLSELTFDVTIVSYLRDYCLIVWYNSTSCSITYRERIEINFSLLWESLIMRIHENYCLVWVFWVFERFQINWSIESSVLKRKILSEEYKNMDLVKTMVF